jgi:hypothetical protein
MRSAVTVLEIGLGIDALGLEIVGRDQPARSRAGIGERQPLPLGIIRPVDDFRVWPGDDDRMVGRFAVVLHRGDGLGATFIVGEHVAPRAHPSHIGLAVGERHRDAGPIRGDHQFIVAAKLIRHVLEERLIGLACIGGSRLEGADSKAQFFLGHGRRVQHRNDKPNQRYYESRFHAALRSTRYVPIP